MYTRIFPFDPSKAASQEGDATAANQQLQITAEQAILAKLIAAPSTEGKQDTIIAALSALAGYEDGIETLLSSLDGKDFATQTTLSAILSKIIAAPATESKQDSIISALATLLGVLPTALTGGGNFKTVIAEALPAGTNIIGVSGVDQTTPGTTDSVTVKASAGVGSLTEAAPASDTASAGLNGRLQRIAQRITSLIGLVPTALSALGNFKIVLSESAVGHKSSVTLTRPATTPTYSAGQAIGDTNGSAVLTFASLGPANAKVLLTDLFLELRVASSTIGRMTAYFYDTQPAAIADAGAWDYASGDHGKMVTFFQISQPADVGSAYLSKNYIGQSVQLGSSGQLYCIIVSDTSFTPVSASVMKIDLYSLEQ